MSKIIFNPLADDGFQYINDDIVIEGGLVPKGEYSSDTNYSIGDMVTYNGSS
jgi:hypothetical protein